MMEFSKKKTNSKYASFLTYIVLYEKKNELTHFQEFIASASSLLYKNKKHIYSPLTVL